MVINKTIKDLLNTTNATLIKKTMLLDLSRFITARPSAYGPLEIKVDSVGIEIVTHYNKISVYSTDVMPYEILSTQLVEVFTEIAILILKKIYFKAGLKGINRNGVEDLFPFIFISIEFVLEGHSETYNHTTFTKNFIKGFADNYSEAKGIFGEYDVDDFSYLLTENLMNSYINSKRNIGKIKIKKSILILKFG